ncbi:MAG: M3 family metallopeptidase [Xanthomonadaceae bacterium]|jgi:oligopeptidase A|nr:M3 family metallopeptidase [Xanthomonadaceae bacterium]
MSNPLLDDTDLPRFDAIEPDHVVPAVDALLAQQRAAIDALVSGAVPRTWDGVMQPQEDLDDRLSRAWAPVSHLHSVRDTPALRDAYGEALEKITDWETELGQNRDLYEAVRAVRDGAGFAALTPVQQRIVTESIRGFELSGVALEEPARSRYREIANELSKLSTEFEQALLDATDAWHLDVADAGALAGLPDSALALLRQYAQEAGTEGWRITLQHPSYVAVLTHADDRALRHTVYEAYATRASDQGPHAGRFDNAPRIERIMALRHEAAGLLGFPNAAEESLATKMAAESARVLGFLRDLAARAKPVAERELAELAVFARDTLGIDALAPWDVAYASEKLRIARYALAEEELKPYFPAERAIEGVFAVSERLFGVRFAARGGVPSWHPDVRYYDVLDAGGAVLAGVYLDLYARSGKRGGAWMDVCRTRRRHAGGVQQPVAFLTCNFAPPAGELPSLLTHDDVVTLFHEFGHGLHHLLTEVDYPSAAGIAGVEWDAVELPSQFMENFCWHRGTLDLFARHWRSGAPLPDDLFRRMTAARHFQAGLFLVRQLEFALFDFRLHLEYDPAQGARALPLLEEVRREVAVLHPPSWHRFPHSFSHIFAGGYGAGYYSYLWAEVLSADAFARFEEAGVLDRGTGEAFRRAVLAVGGSRPALESFIEFRGREPDPAALLRSYGLAA